jgi:hypothetical protein
VLGRRELIDVLAHLAAPLTPFALEGAPDDEALFIDWIEQRSQVQLKRILDDAVEAFIDLVRKPPEPAEYTPPARDENAFQSEFLGLAELYGQTPHGLRILQAIEPILHESSTRLWAIEVLGRLKLPAAIPLLRAIAASSITKEEELSIVDAIGEIGGQSAQALLKHLRERCTEVEVRSKIDAVLEQLSAC